MNKFDEKYIFRLGNSLDIDNIMYFIKRYWDSQHILSEDKNFFEYEFLDEENVNVMLAIDKRLNTIEAIAGFLKCSKVVENQDVWGSFWKVNTTKNNMTFLGIELIKRLSETLQCRNHLGIGINPKTTLPLRKTLFNEKIEKMNHYYILNEQIETYKIANIRKKYNFEIKKSYIKYNIIRYKNIDEIKQNFSLTSIKTIPYKDFWYIEKRYLKHPYFSYEIYGLINENMKTELLIVLKEVEQFGRKILRIVDCIGNFQLFSYYQNFFWDLLKQQKYEYIDLYNWGINQQVFLNVGFKLKDEHDPNIIPNYFEPFEQRNIDIWVRYKEENTVFFKADGDQDRPRMIRR